VRFPDVRGLEQTWVDLEAPAKGEATYYYHMQRWDRGPRVWPPPALAEAAE
jgi:hypothetical protein